MYKKTKTKIEQTMERDEQKRTTSGVTQSLTNAKHKNNSIATNLRKVTCDDDEANVNDAIDRNEPVIANDDLAAMANASRSSYRVFGSKTLLLREMRCLKTTASIR
jgi:hypothetical protein